MIKVPSIAVLYHIFYEDSCDIIILELQPLAAYSPFFLFNICEETPGKENICKALKSSFPDCFIIITSNKGKDIGAKLALLQLLLSLEISADYLLFLHDKKSLQALKSKTWKTDLLKIISADNIQAILSSFQKNDSCGIIATKEYIINETIENNQFIGANGGILNDLLKKYSLKPASYEFVAGTMFWARYSPLKSFFVKYSPLEIRKEFENGNVIDNFSGTVTHSWERILNWIISANGYHITGI